MKDDLLQIPGVGKQMKLDFIHLGFPTVSSLKGQDPDALYQRQCQYQNTQVDRCVLYVYRCAIYYANHQKHDPEKLKWWYWKDHDNVEE